MAKINSFFKPARLTRLHTVFVGNTLADLHGTVRTLGREIMRSQVPIYLEVGGYDHDSRELGDIPEVQSLCERLIESGLISFMHVNVVPDRNPMLWGAFDVWACAQGRIKNGVINVSKEEILAFFTDVLLPANERANAVMNAS